MFKRRTCLAVFAAVVMIFILAKQLNEEKAPLTINGDPVSEEELAFHDGSLERTVRSREIWNWAAEGGMADEFSYDDLIQSLENENRERKKLQSEGGSCMVRLNIRRFSITADLRGSGNGCCAPAFWRKRIHLS